MNTDDILFYILIPVIIGVILLVAFILWLASRGKNNSNDNKTNQNDDVYSRNYSENYYIVDKMTKNSYVQANKLNFKYLFVTICKNGGLIAMCKTPDYFISKDNPLNKHLIVMHQDSGTVYKIWNSDLFTKRKLVGLEFNDKEQLYAFCDDGEIFKVDILRKQVIQLPLNYIQLQDEKILKVKPFEKGFIILTGAGTIFYLKDLKNKEESLEFMVSLRDNLKIKEFQDCDFLAIPSEQTEKDSDEEILVMKPNQEGVYLIKKIKSSGSQFMVKSRKQDYSDMKLNVLFLNSSNIEKFDTKLHQIDNEDLENQLNENLRIGPISGFAISNSKKKIALYVSKKKSVYMFSSNIPSKGRLNFKKYQFKFEFDEFEPEDNIKEKNKILNFNNKELVFLNDDCVAICGGRWVVMVNEKGDTLIEEICNEKDKNDISKTDDYVYCKSVSEVDGFRLLTKEEVSLFRKLPEDLKPVYDHFNTTPTKILLSSYEKYLAKDPFSNDELREIKDNLSDSIFCLAKAAGYLYWVEKEQDTHAKKELQTYFLKAANYGKCIFGKAEFNFDRFNNLLMDLRIINALRNYEKQSRFLTLEEYKCLVSDSSDGILKKTMRQLNFKLAFEIAKFMGLPERDVYLKYAIKKIQKIEIEDSKEADEVYSELIPMLKKLENISYIDIAKKCFKYKKFKLGKKFLENEKSSLVKIPQYLELKDWNKAIKLAIESNDINAITVVLDNVYKVEQETAKIKDDAVNDQFVFYLAQYPNIKIQVINYLKKNNKLKTLQAYLIEIKDTEELFYFTVENFFQSKTKNEREEILKQLKSYKFEKSDNKKFFENYISDLESSLKFKKECLEKGIYTKNDTTNFDNSIFDCFEKAIPTEFDWVLKQNHNYFKLSNRKITILRFKQLFKNKKIDEIENIINKEGIKKLDISYVKIAKMFFDNGNREKALEYAQKENNELLVEEKVDILIKLEKYIEAAEAALKIKDRDKFEEIFDNKLGPKVKNDPNLIEQIQIIHDKKK